MAKNQIIQKIKNIFLDKNKDLTNELKHLSEQLLEYLNSVKKEYNVYTHVNQNIVDDILSRFAKGFSYVYFYSIKDAFFKKGYYCSAASKILANYYPNIDSRVASIMDKDYILIGITNCDEFCCGSYGTNSCYGPVNMPDKLHIGGSSSGASADCLLEISDINIGTDTGGSCRFPSKFVNAYGFKPTYGVISRYGLISYAQSLDTVGFILQDLSILEHALKHLYVYDKYDSCMIHHSYKEYQSKNLNSSKQDEKIKVLVIDYKKMDNSQIEFLNCIQNDEKYSIEYLNLQLNVNMIWILYEILSSIEFFSSLNRYDNVKHGSLSKVTKLEMVYEDRFNYLGSNTRGKTMLGALFLYNKDLRKYYYTVLEKRSTALYTFISLFKKYESECSDVVIITPEIDSTSNKAFESYNFISNICGTCCISIPMKKYNQNVSREEYSSLLVHGNMKKDNLIIYFAKETQKYA